MFSAAALIHGRLSFKQILFFLSYVLVESSLLASIGNNGQIQDLLARQEDDWNPHIGEETYPDMIHKGWNATSRETHQAWGKIRQYMVQQNLIGATVSPSDLRVLLGQLLFRIEQISAQGFNAVRHQKAKLNIPGFPFSERGILALICMSVSVTIPSGGSVSLQALLADPHQHITEELRSKLPESPLFHEEVSQYEIRAAFKSLDELFRSLSVFPNVIDEQSDGGNRACDMTPPMTTTRLETWTYFCETRETGLSPRGPSSKPKRAEVAGFARESAQDATRLQKRRKRTHSETTEDVDQGTRLRIQYPTAR